MVMDAYSSLCFKYHSSISAAFIPFLTKQAAANSTTALNAKLKIVEKSVSDLEGTVMSKIQRVEQQVTHTDSRLDAL